MNALIWKILAAFGYERDTAKIMAPITRIVSELDTHAQAQMQRSGTLHTRAVQLHNTAEIHAVEAADAQASARKMRETFGVA